MRPRHYIKEITERNTFIGMCGARFSEQPRDTAPRCERCRVEVEKLKAPTSAKAKAERVLGGKA